MLDLDSLTLDLVKMDEGAWVNFPGHPDTKFKVARMYNAEFNALFEKLRAPYIGEGREANLTEELAQDILVTCMSKTILKDWSGLASKGVQIPYSVEKAKELLLDKKRPQIRQFVAEVASTEAHYREKEIQETAGKSEPSSNGNSSGESTKPSSEA